MRRIDRIRKSVVSRVLAAGVLQPEGGVGDSASLQLSGHMMRHLLYRTRLRQRRILDELIESDSNATIHDMSPWW
jgi:hypothetical protein